MARSMARVVRGASGMVTNLPPQRGDHQGPVPSLDAKGFNVGASGFGDPKSRNLSEQVWGILGKHAEYLRGVC
jgi:hypothetical protein